MIMRQLTLMGSWIYNLGQFEEIVDHVLERDLPLEELITHRFTIDQAEEGVPGVRTRARPARWCSHGSPEPRRRSPASATMASWSCRT